MKRLGLLVLATSLAIGASAQVLDTVEFTDQLDQGTRGLNDNPSDGGGVGGAAFDGSEFELYTPPQPDLTITPNTTSVVYMNTFATGNPESPVLDVTVSQTNPDRGGSNILPAITANNRPGATGGSTAIYIGDDGGHNELIFGSTFSADYFAEVDMFCPVTTVGAGFEEAGLAVRACRNQGVHSSFSYSVRREGSYVITYNYQTNAVQAGEYENLGTGIGAFTPYGNPITLTGNGWHTLRIECVADQITFLFDGSQLASVTDDTFPVGRGAIYYSESGVDPDKERQGVFDRLTAGPSGTSTVSDWTLY